MEGGGRCPGAQRLPGRDSLRGVCMPNDCFKREGLGSHHHHHTITPSAQAPFSEQKAPPWRIVQFCQREWDCSNFYQARHNTALLPSWFLWFFWHWVVWSDSENQELTTCWFCLWFIARLSFSCNGFITHQSKPQPPNLIGSQRRELLFDSIQLWNLCPLQLHLCFYFT